MTQAEALIELELLTIEDATALYPGFFRYDCPSPMPILWFYGLNERGELLAWMFPADASPDTYVVQLARWTIQDVIWGRTGQWEPHGPLGI